MTGNTYQEHQHAVAALLPRRHVSHAVFDFDGTLSWLRHGWPQKMLETFLEHAPAHWRQDGHLCAELLADILSLNGKPSIHQLALCCERARAAGFEVPNAERLLEKYLPTIRNVVTERISAIRSGCQAPEDFIVWNARRALEILRARGIVMIILSGTAEADVRAEAKVLGLDSYFGDHIYGSMPDGTFSKKDVIDRILREEGIQGNQLLAFGDGPVEIRCIKDVGGLAIGVASDEEVNGSHRIDLAKQHQLMAAGADAIIADYEKVEALLNAILPM